MNNVTLVGRFTRDPELRQTQSGLSVTKFTIAVDRRFKDQNGEYGADFISCTAWRQTAEFIAKYFQKGQRIGIIGNIQTGSYDHQDGHKVYTTDVVVDQAHFVESKRDDYGQNRDTNSFNDSFTSSPSDDTSLPFDL